MPWTRGRERTADEKRRISLGVRRYYRAGGSFIRTRNILEYKDPYNYRRKFSRLMKRISESDMNIANKKTLCRFKREILLYAKIGHAYNSIRTVFSLFQDYKKPLRDLTEEEAMELYRKIQESDISDYTKFSRVARLKFFIAWLKNGKRPRYISKMKCRKTLKSSRYFSLDDVKIFLGACESEEERTFFALLWEGGFSVGELLKIRLNDITARPESIDIHVQSKDRDRITPILREKGKIFPLGSYGLFKRHLKRRRFKPNENIWSLKSYNQVQYRINKIRKKVGLHHIRSHSFRKSRATYNDENGMSYAQNCVYGGWRIGSRTLQHYILTSGRTLIPTLHKLNLAFS